MTKYEKAYLSIDTNDCSEEDCEILQEAIEKAKKYDEEHSKERKQMRFVKVDYDTFKKDCEKVGIECSYEDWQAIKLPRRSTNGSAGYDFYSPFNFGLGGIYDVHKFPTGIRVENMDEDNVLILCPRSSLGTNYGISLAGTLGVIDSDYTLEIWATFKSGFKPCFIEKGDRYMQGIFLSFYKTDDDEPLQNERVGGLGSTGR